MSDKTPKNVYHVRWAREHGNTEYIPIYAQTVDEALEAIKAKTAQATKYDSVTFTKFGEDDRFQWRKVDHTWVRESTTQQLVNQTSRVQEQLRRMRELLGNVLRVSSALHNAGATEIMEQPEARDSHGIFSYVKWKAARGVDRVGSPNAEWRRCSAQIELTLGGTELRDGHWVFTDPNVLTWEITGQNAGRPFAGDKGHPAREYRTGSCVVGHPFRLPPEPFALIRYCAGLCQGPGDKFSYYLESWRETDYCAWVEREGNVPEIEGGKS